MGTKPALGRASGWSLKTIRLNWREILPVRSPRHPGNLSTPPTDAIAVLWLDSEGTGSDPRFAYLNYNRAEHLYTELGHILNGAPPVSAVERARRMLNHTEGVRGEVSGA